MGERLKDKVAIVTGCKMGIGKAIALGFAEAGADVVVSTRVLKDEKYDLEPDTIFYVPNGVFHHIINTSAETMKLINVFAPGMDRDEQKKKIVVKNPPGV